jgi:hypothetical protein
MPDCCSDVLSVDLFTTDEELVLATWLEIDRPPDGRQVDDIFDGWNIPSEIPYYRRIDTAVAQILLERIQDHLPNWTALAGDRFVIARRIFDRRARRKIELWPHHLLTINWADSGPGFSWPVAYKATYVPVFDRTVVTASADCPETFGGVSDVAIGAFGSETSILEGSRRIIISDWTNQCASTIKSAGPICSTPGSSARPKRTHGPTRFGVMAARSGVRTNAPHLCRPREPRGRRKKSAAWPDLPQLRHYPCEDSAPPARPRPALLERAAFANPHDDCGSRILEVERQQNGGSESADELMEALELFGKNVLPHIRDV